MLTSAGVLDALVPDPRVLRARVFHARIVTHEAQQRRLPVQQPGQRRGAQLPGTWLFQAEFEQADPARAAADYARLTEEIKHADAAAANASLDDTFTSNGEVMSLRMIYLHMIEEYARHLGHADLLREQIDGVTGE